MAIFRVLGKFRFILSRHQKIRIIELCVLMIIAGFMEMLSVSLILPFVEAIVNPDKIMHNKYVLLLCRMFGIESHRTFLVFLALVMAAIYIIKNIFLLFQMTIQNRFVYNNMFATQQALLKSYLLRPYEYFLGVKSGEILRIIGSDTSRAFSILTQILSLLSETVVSAVLLFTIFLTAPGITIAMGAILLVMIWFIQTLLRPLLKTAGKIHQTTYANMNQWLLQSIQGIKEVKLMKREQYFQDNFQKEGRAYVKAVYQSLTYGMVPRFMIEAVAMCIFFVTVAIMIYKGAALEDIIPIVSAIAMAAIRLLPSVNRISGNISNITFGEPAVDKMLEHLLSLKEYEARHMLEETDTKPGYIKNLQKSIDLSDIVYGYSSGTANVLNHATLHIDKGMSAGIVGASGAGKTTAVDILLGLLKPQNGKVLVDGTDIQMDMDGWLSNIGYIPQSIFMLDGSIRENVAFGVNADTVEDSIVWDALQEAAIADFIRSLPEGLDTQIGERGMRLSGGQKQRIGIARALYTNPSVLVFDEATSALDNETEAAIMDSINHLRGTKTLIIIAHRLSTIEGCDVVYRVENGQIERER